MIFKNITNNNKSIYGKRYSSEILQFSLSLHYYSTKAYEYLRGMLCLPCRETLRKQTNIIYGKPGITIEAFIAIGKRAKENKLSKYVNIIIDGMKIKEHKEYNRWSGEDEGLINYGDGDGDTNIAAKEVVVCLVSGVFDLVKVPVGYMLVNGITAKRQKIFLESVVLNLLKVFNLYFIFIYIMYYYLYSLI